MVRAITTTPIQVASAYKTLLTGYSSTPFLHKNIDTVQKVKLDINDEFIEFLLGNLNLVTNKNGTAYFAFEVLEKSK